MTETITSIDATFFKSRQTEIVDLFVNAMESSAPWSELGLKVHRVGTVETFDSDSSKDNFGAVVAEDDGKIIGVSTFRHFELEDISEENEFILPEELKTYLTGLQEIHDLKRFLYLSRTFVDPVYQGRGIASKLREKVVEEVVDEQDSAVIITKHLSTNLAIVASSKRLGFLETGVKQASNDGSYYDEYWYRVIPAKLPTMN